MSAKRIYLQSENLKLDSNNLDFNNAIDFINNTNKNVFITGRAGTGKTTFLKYITENTNKNFITLAPTGVAAINAKGMTINSFFQIDFSVFVPDDSRLDNKNIRKTFSYRKEKIDIIRNLDLLIIDEISMVRCDLIDVINKILQVYRNDKSPFGGVQVLFLGDVFQLSPILIGEKKDIIEQFYDSGFFFSAQIIKKIDLVFIQLRTIYRQKEQDFIDMLNRVRVGKVTQNDINTLNSKFSPDFNQDEFISLCTHNRIVDSINSEKLYNISTKSFYYDAIIEGDFRENSYPTDKKIELKLGAQVMFIKNNKDKGYFNGKITTISRLEDNAIWVWLDNEEIELDLAEWDNVTYKYNKQKRTVEQEVMGTFKQYPVKLAWAITVHKSQGLTFEKVYADLGDAFSAGQVYVALSRCTSFNNLFLKTPITKSSVIIDRNAIEFSKRETPDTLITNHLNQGKADFLYKKCRKYFDEGDFKKSLNTLQEALKYRNDFDTEIFEKYFTTKMKRLFSYKSKLIKAKKNSNKRSGNEKLVFTSPKQISQKSSTSKNARPHALDLILNSTWVYYWKKLDSDHELKEQLICFHKDGLCSYYGEKPKNKHKWLLTGNRLMWSLNDTFIIYSGIVDVKNQSIKGYAKNIANFKIEFTAERKNKFSGPLIKVNYPGTKKPTSDWQPTWQYPAGSDFHLNNRDLFKYVVKMHI